MRVVKFIVAAAIVAGAVAGSQMATSTRAVAQDAAGMSCDQLWYARNAIYARKGFCFRTARAQDVFGPGCFPPYGRLNRSEREQVNELQYWERRRGC